jgi:hypothetical protein
MPTKSKRALLVSVLSILIGIASVVLSNFGYLDWGTGEVLAVISVILVFVCMIFVLITKLSEKQ